MEGWGLVTFVPFWLKAKSAKVTFPISGYLYEGLLPDHVYLLPLPLVRICRFDSLRWHDAALAAAACGCEPPLRMVVVCWWLAVCSNWEVASLGSARGYA